MKLRPDPDPPRQARISAHEYPARTRDQTWSAPGRIAEPDNLVLEHLRALRSDVATIREDVREVKSRITNLEHSVAGIYFDIADLNGRHDRILSRIERIERRLELAG
jgi:hypothetical protein